MSVYKIGFGGVLFRIRAISHKEAANAWIKKIIFKKGLNPNDINTVIVVENEDSGRVKRFGLEITPKEV